MPTRPALRHVVVVLDRSGSMASIASEVVGGFNQLLAELRSADPDALVTLIQFDDEDPFEVVVNARPVDTPDVTADQYQPRGTTPLYDALGWTFNHLAGRAARRADGELPAEAMEIVTITDGLENASRRWGAHAIAGRIRRRKEAGWRFRYLGANQDAWAEGARIGLDRGDVAGFVADPVGTRAMFTALSADLGRPRPASRNGR
ncbi:MAG: hypothetical protein ACRDYF_16570 [Acidimicrobiia bacterium]